jgi:hypothetical protein
MAAVQQAAAASGAKQVVFAGVASGAARGGLAPRPSTTWERGDGRGRLTHRTNEPPTVTSVLGSVGKVKWRRSLDMVGKALLSTSHAPFTMSHFMALLSCPSHDRTSIYHPPTEISR